MTYSITRGAKARAVRCCVYGPEGVGKTTFGAQWPGAVFIDVEDGSGHYDVARLPAPKTWNELLDSIMWCSFSDEVQTVVVDTVDKAEKLCVEHIKDRDNKDSLESWGYGKGYTILAEEFKKLFEALDACVEHGKNVLVLGHAQIKKFEQPDEMGSYDRWELKLEKKCAPLLKEWCDVLLFANYRTDMVRDENGKYHAEGGKRRIMYASHTSAYDAKNRLGLPDEMPFDFAQIADKVPTLATGGTVEEPAVARSEPAQTPVQDDNVVKDVKFADVTPPEIGQLHSLMERDGITREQVQMAVGEGRNNPYTPETTFGEYDMGFVRDVLVAHWADIAKQIKDKAAYADDIPF